MHVTYTARKSGADKVTPNVSTDQGPSPLLSEAAMMNMMRMLSMSRSPTSVSALTVSAEGGLQAIPGHATQPSLRNDR